MMKNRNLQVQLSAKEFIRKLSSFKTEGELDKVEKYFKGNDGITQAFGVRFGDIFRTAREFSAMPLKQINELLDSDFYEIRMGAVSIMDYQAKDKKITDKEKKSLFDLYLKRHDRLNNWDFVDRAAFTIIGEYLVNRPRKILYTLAKSKDPWERRTAIVSTYAFIRRGETADTFKVAEILVNDKHELINKAVGSWIREAGKKDKAGLLAFLDKYAATMPRETLRYAIEKLDSSKKKYYLKLKNV